MQVRSFFVVLSGVTELPKRLRNSIGSNTAASQEISLPSFPPGGTRQDLRERRSSRLVRVLIPSKKRDRIWITRYSILYFAFCFAGKAETVPDWLKALDLGQYESSLMANGFDNIRFLVRPLGHKFMLCGSPNLVKLKLVESEITHRPVLLHEAQTSTASSLWIDWFCFALTSQLY